MDWISTAERLPGKAERVLVYTPFDYFGSDHSCIGNKESISTCKAKVNGRIVPVFTHWMPLPELPHS